MILKNSVSILYGNMNLVFKLMAYFLVLILIISAFFVLIINPFLHDVSKEIDLKSILEIAEDSINEGQFKFSDLTVALKNIYGAIVNFFSTNVGYAILMLFKLWVLILISRIILSLAYLPITKILHDKMTVNYSSGFLSSLISSLGYSIRYATLSNIIILPLDTLIFVISITALTILFPIMNILAATIAFMVFFSLITLRISLLTMWLPNIIVTNKVAASLLPSIKESAKTIKKTYTVFFTITITGFALSVTTLISTAGLIPILIVPFTIVISKAVELVCYFNFHKKKFYATEQKIVDTQNFDLFDLEEEIEATKAIENDDETN